MNALPLDTALPAGAAVFALMLLLKAAAVVVAALVLTRLLRRRSAALRHAVWGTALAMLLLLPGLALQLPAWRVPLFASLAPVEQPALYAPLAPAAPLPGAVSGTSLVQTGRPAPLPLHDFKDEASGVPYSPWTALALLWAGGTAWALLRLLGQRLLVSRVYARASEAPDDGRSLLPPLARRFGIRREVRLRCSAEITMPVTWGLLRPVVLLPDGAAGWPEERLRVVLLHELAHVKRLDYLWHVVSEVACAAYWPNPLVWLARRRMQAEQEQACDDRVLRMGAPSVEYAEHLLEVARAFDGGRSARAAVAMAREAGLKGRLRAILDRRLNRRPVTPLEGLGLTAVIAAVALPLAALRPGVAEEAEEIPAAPGFSSGISAAVPVGAGPDTLSGRVYLWLEAEDGVLARPMQLNGDLDASGGRFIEVADDHDSRDRPPSNGRAAFRVHLDRAGTFVLWGRVLTPNDEEDSFWVRVDGGPWIQWNDMPEQRAWRWIPVYDARQGREAARFDLGPGDHAVEVAYREDDARLDRLLLTDDPAFVPEGRGPAPAASEPVYLWMEAEDAELADPMRIDRNDRASGGRYVAVPAGSRNGEGTATFTFTVLQPASYTVWGRAMGPEDNENSFFISVDDGREAVWDIPGRDPERTAKRWTWDPAGARDSDTDPIIFDLKPGRHTIRVRNRESGTKLDGLLVTNDLGYRPQGQGPLLPPSRPTYVSLEAESAHLPPSMEKGDDEGASSGGYVTVKSGRKSQETPPTGGRLTYTFDVPEEGRYLLWGRVSAPDDGSDSFWIRVNGGPWVRWNGIERSKSWRWNTVHDADYGAEVVQFALPSGPQTLEVAYREDGIRLDKLIVTNDPAYRPKGADGAGR